MNSKIIVEEFIAQTMTSWDIAIKMKTLSSKKGIL
jgi:hypothetical protein